MVRSYHNNHKAIETLSMAKCHTECINLSRYDLFSYFSLKRHPASTITYNDYDRIDSYVVQIMKRYNYLVTINEITCAFRQQFVRLLKTHQEKLKRIRHNSSKLRKFLSHLKQMRFKLCVIGQHYTLGNVSISLHASELIRSRKSVEALSKQVALQRSQINKLRHYLSEKSTKYRLLRKKYNSRLRLADLTKSMLSVRHKKYLIIKFLKNAAQKNSIHLLSATFTVPGSDLRVAHNFDNGCAEKNTTPEVASQVIDSTNMSMRKYQSMQKILPNVFPVPGKVRKFRRAINEIIPVEETRSEGKWYAEAKFSVLLVEAIDSLFRSGRLSRDITTIKVKLSGDGTRISRHVNIVTLCFVIIVNGETCQRSTDVSNIVVASCKEKSEYLRTAFRNAIEEIKRTTEVTIRGRSYDLCYFFASDYKFILITLGMKSATSSCPCMYCRKLKIHFRNTKVSARRRTIDNMGSQKEGVSEHEPLISFIPLNRFVPDHLHLKLRIMDQQFKYVIDQISLLDSDAGKKEKNHMARLELYLKRIGIDWTYIIDPKTKTAICGLRFEFLKV